MRMLLRILWELRLIVWCLSSISSGCDNSNVMVDRVIELDQGAEESFINICPDDPQQVSMVFVEMVRANHPPP